ncbi:glycosyltransferase family 9 protein [Oleidesulfovibrio sp.]|uniref:glycosyltransferase family 9 protein n=1 Tax=Oleidesulfovibrio sp. TaxID=2909707 RepID=UPI003A898A93
MSSRPILVIQMQRMGDLVLTFPLLGWLRLRFPDAPIWVVAEPVFFKGLMALSPAVTFFPPDAAPALVRESFSAIINLSHRPNAARLAGSAKADAKYGPYDDNGAIRIGGQWQLYRTSLTHNNRHNAFHWADMNALDSLPLQTLQKTFWPTISYTKASEGRVGLFLGASEIDKRPSAQFWASLAENLLSKGLKPVLLGGKAELALASEVAALINAPALNMAGRFSLPELVEVLHSLRLLVTPDTGPMHVAAWVGTPTLNLSMGPVSAWETAPFPPGHFVLQSTISCVGCWRCKHKRPLCHDAFTPHRIASLVRMMLSTSGSFVNKLHLPGLELLKTSRDEYGLYRLSSLEGQRPDSSLIRQPLKDFWQAFFGYSFGVLSGELVAIRWKQLTAGSPAIAQTFIPAVTSLSRALTKSLKDPVSIACQDFWQKHPPFMRPLSGYLQQALTTEDCSRPAYSKALQMIESLLGSISDNQ